MTAPRLHVVTATDADEAVVLRRGPSHEVALIGWNRLTGETRLGQWLRGRIYEHRSDLSPDGRHFVYFAGTGLKWWTAISRAPYLTALVFLPQGSTWGGGGAFTAPGRVWLGGGGLSHEAPDGLQLEPDLYAYPASTDGFHMGDTYAAKQVRRGWEHGEGTGYAAALRKPAGEGWSLELTFGLGMRNRAIISNCYALVRDVERIELPDWEWADLYGDTVQFARAGCLWSAHLSPDGVIRSPDLIADFCDMTFEAIEAPYQGVSGA